MAKWRIPGGIHALTPDGLPTEQLLAAVHSALQGGVSLVQYRDKVADQRQRVANATALAELCRGRVPLLINDSPQLAAQVGAAGTHLGPEDAPLRQARAALGDEALLGASCRGQLALTASAAQASADYLAFGCCFPSHTKPDAPPLSLPELTQLVAAARSLDLPSVAIGGIDADNMPELAAAEPHAVAVCAAIFAAPDIEGAARALHETFARHFNTT